MRLKLYTLNDMLHIFKELEYMVPMMLNLNAYCLIHWLQSCLAIRFSPCMLGIIIKSEDLK
jgi:hypothetical protein